MSKLTVHIVLDRSGSMGNVRDDTIGAFNTYVQDLAKTSPDSKLSLTIFDNMSIDTIIDHVAIGEVKPLNREIYVPRGGTPLYDAIGLVVAKLDTAKGKNKALVIMTDGQENASREHSKESIRKLIEARQKEANWLVIFLGADQDAFAEGAKFGTQHGSTMQMKKSGKGLRSSFAAASASTARYAASGGDLKMAAFTDAERKDALDED